MSRRLVIIPVALSLALGGTALLRSSSWAQTAAKRKGAPACGLTTFPLTAGAEWTYKQIGGPGEVKLSVAEIGPGKDAAGRAVTAILVEETYLGSTSRLTWTCTAEGLRIPLGSFMWAGEPGDVVGQTVTETSHTDYWMHPDVHVVPGSGWTETIKADVVRADASGKGVTHTPAKLELERNFNVEQSEDITTPAGTFKALRLGFFLRGRAIIGADKAEIPASGDPGHVWFAKGIGPVKIEDNLNPKLRRSWELVATNLK